MLRKHLSVCYEGCNAVEGLLHAKKASNEPNCKALLGSLASIHASEYLWRLLSGKGAVSTEAEAGLHWFLELRSLWW